MKNLHCLILERGTGQGTEENIPLSLSADIHAKLTGLTSPTLHIILAVLSPMYLKNTWQWRPHSPDLYSSHHRLHTALFTSLSYGRYICLLSQVLWREFIDVKGKAEQRDPPSSKRDWVTEYLHRGNYAHLISPAVPWISPFPFRQFSCHTKYFTAKVHPAPSDIALP